MFQTLVDTQVEKRIDVRARFAWRAGYLLAAFGIYMADQASKAWAVRALRFGDERVVVPGFFQFIYTENPGIAFGQLQEGGSFGRWFFVVLAILAALAVLFYFMRTPRNDDRVLGACALLLAGISGNLTDRARLGFFGKTHPNPIGLTKIGCVASEAVRQITAQRFGNGVLVFLMVLSR